jgi:lysozyme
MKVQADAWFDEDVMFAEDAVDKLDVRLTQSMFDALVSLCYNCGPAPVQKGKTIGNALRAGDYDEAAEGFHLWVKQAGITLPGLVRRRADEVSLFWEDGLPS